MEELLKISADRRLLKAHKWIDNILKRFYGQDICLLIDRVPSLNGGVSKSSLEIKKPLNLFLFPLSFCRPKWF